MNETDLVAGQEVFVVCNNKGKGKFGVLSYTYLASSGEMVIVTPFVGELEYLDEILSFHYEKTAKSNGTKLCVFKKTDCYGNWNEAAEALERNVRRKINYELEQKNLDKCKQM